MEISKKYADILNNSDISGLSEELKIQYIKYQYENNEIPNSLRGSLSCVEFLGSSQNAIKYDNILTDN